MKRCRAAAWSADGARTTIHRAHVEALTTATSIGELFALDTASGKLEHSACLR